MCDTKRACAEAKAAKAHAGEWCLEIDATAAGNVQYVMEAAARDGVELLTVDQVLLFCLATVANFVAAREVFDLADAGERGAAR